VSDPMQDIQQIMRILSQKPEIAATVLSVTKALTEVRYGEISIKMQGGKAQWVDKIERERVG
jgi:hypothetical protein